MRLPSLDAPEPGAICQNCGRELVIEGFCGACAEHDRLRDDPLRLAEARMILNLAADWDDHSSDVDPGRGKW